MAQVWLSAHSAQFRYRSRCEGLAAQLHAAEQAQLGDDGAVAARELQIVFGVAVDQLMRSQSEFWKPSLFQRLLVEAYFKATIAARANAGTLLERAVAGLPEDRGVALRRAWEEMERWFAVRDDERHLMQAVVDVGQK